MSTTVSELELANTKVAANQLIASLLGREGNPAATNSEHRTNPWMFKAFALQSFLNSDPSQVLCQAMRAVTFLRPQLAKKASKLFRLAVHWPTCLE